VEEWNRGGNRHTVFNTLHRARGLCSILHDYYLSVLSNSVRERSSLGSSQNLSEREHASLSNSRDLVSLGHGLSHGQSVSMRDALLVFRVHVERIGQHCSPLSKGLGFEFNKPRVEARIIGRLTGLLYSSPRF